MTITNTISHIVFHMKEKCNMCKVYGSCVFGQLLKGFQPEGLYFGVCFFSSQMRGNYKLFHKYTCYISCFVIVIIKLLEAYIQ